MDDTDGPGHNPTNPQPVPNNIEPKISLKLIPVFFGKLNSLPNREFLLFLNK